MSLEERWEVVKSGKYDILANDVLRTHTKDDSILFTHPILLSKQVLVQRKPQSTKDSLYIKSHLDLAHKTLHIVKGSPYKQRIENLSNEIGDTIYIEEIDKYGIEQLLALVAHGDIDYAVCDEGIAMASMKDFPQLDIDTPISFTQFNSWGVNKQSIVLLDTLNAWLDHYTKTKAFKKLRKKYYKY
jgi:ABC-type amino acid transport substrate-binding protein